jgi:hypothetical protein
VVTTGMLIRRPAHEVYATYVVITESGLAGTGDEIVAHLVDSASGFSKILAALKALLEHGIALKVVADHQP